MQLRSIHRQGSPERLVFINFKGENEHKKVKNVIRPYLLLQIFPMIPKNRGVNLVGLRISLCNTPFIVRGLIFYFLLWAKDTRIRKLRSFMKKCKQISSLMHCFVLFLVWRVNLFALHDHYHHASELYVVYNCLPNEITVCCIIRDGGN